MAFNILHLSVHTFNSQRQITLRIVGYLLTSRLTATLNLCPIYLKLLVHVLYQYVQYSCDFEVSQIKIKGGCQSGRKVVPPDSVICTPTYILCTILHNSFNLKIKWNRKGHNVLNHHFKQLATYFTLKQMRGSNLVKGKGTCMNE